MSLEQKAVQLLSRKSSKGLSQQDASHVDPVTYANGSVYSVVTFGEFK